MYREVSLQRRSATRMPVIKCRMLTTVTLCLIAASLGATIDMYDDMPSEDISLMNQEHNYVDSGLNLVLPESNPDDTMKRFLIYKMLNSFRNQDVSPNLLAGPKWISSGTFVVPSETFDLSLSKGPIMKRVTDVRGAASKVRPVSKPSPKKWKIKKGKVGSPMICYFKLCAFRPPN